MEIITSHLNADFDSLASMIAAKKIYPGARIVFPGSQERKVREFIEVFHPADITRIKDVDFGQVERLIIVDTKRPERIGPLAGLLANGEIKVHVYDHHPFDEDDIRGELERIEEVGATATLFAEMLKEKKLDPTPMEATILCLGIYEETGSLLFPSTTERDLQAVAYLLRRGANLNIVSSYIRMGLNVEELDLLNELIKSSTEVIVRGVRAVITRASRESYVGDAANLAHRIMEMEDVDAAILLLDMEGKIQLIGRSKVPELDVAEIAKEFGGGGHPTASSATIREASVEVVADRVKDLVRRFVKPLKVASDIMTSPVITIGSDSTIKEAEDMLTRYGVNVLPILKGGRYAGLISREVVEKAIFHGFRQNRCVEFASTEAMTVSPETPIREVETMMIEHNQRFMPVLVDGNITGAITRTDLLRVLYEEFLRKRHLDREEMMERAAPGRNLASWLRERFPKEVYQVLKTAGEVAEKMGYNAYLVGGSVRDLLLGQENLDIDIVVEGDGILFAKELSARLGAKVKPHERFGTAHISMKKGQHVDVATARTEYYESPAALPKVETSSIKRDLYRRDFTINTLAVKLNPGDFGRLLDFFGGQRDLREKTVRVLHNLSYVEDPTRAFRAIRFGERFGFKLSKHTENLIRSAIQMNLFGMLSGSRLYDELILAFKETNPVSTLKRLSEVGLLKVIHEALAFDDKLEAVLASLAETITWYNLLYLDREVDVGLLYLMALLSNLGEEDKKATLERLDAPPRTRQIVMQGGDQSAVILRKLPTEDAAALYHLLANVDLETILFAMALTKDKKKKKDISRFLVDLRKVKPLLRGSDLRKLGLPEGPLYSKCLGELLDERLRGRLKTEEDERRFVMRRYAGKVSGGERR